MKKLNKAREVFKIKNSIFAARPNIYDVEVKIKELYRTRSLIELTVFINRVDNISYKLIASDLKKGLFICQNRVLKNIRFKNLKVINNREELKHMRDIYPLSKIA